jgi:intracellular multiplication protein IcmN
MMSWLTGCQHSEPFSSFNRLPQRLSGASDTKVIKMQADFKKQDILVVTMGQNYLISIPVKLIFPTQSPQLSWAAYGLLSDVTCFLKLFRKEAVYVTGYSNRCAMESRERALTMARARTVSDYLWSQGVDSRFMFVQGLGSDKPIIPNKPKPDSPPNARIEITFREIMI